MEPPIQALVMLAVLAASAILFTVVFVIVADRELAKPVDSARAREERSEDEDRSRSETDGEERVNREERSDENGGGRGA